VNPKYAAINGVACYRAIADIPGSSTWAIVAVPAKFVAAVLRDLGGTASNRSSCSAPASRNR